MREVPPSLRSRTAWRPIGRVYGRSTYPRRRYFGGLYFYIAFITFRCTVFGATEKLPSKNIKILSTIAYENVISH